MTKEPKEQKTIDGAADKVTEGVRVHAKLYAADLHEWQRLQKNLEVLRASLLEKMEADDVDKLEVTIEAMGETVRYEVERDVPEAKPKIKCKKLGED